MPLNESKGNMYGFITHTWNPIKGCEHDCSYCYLKTMYGGAYAMNPRLDLNELSTNLGTGNFIFVGSTTDMFGEFIPDENIKMVFDHCRKYPGNRYLFQSKNPIRFKYLKDWIPPTAILGTTLETNNYQNGFNSKAPSPVKRYLAMKDFDMFPKMVSIEPIMDLDPGILTNWISNINPVFVSIGADSKGSDLKEPNAATIKTLIRSLRKVTEVILKDNLKRLLPEEEWI